MGAGTEISRTPAAGRGKVRRARIAGLCLLSVCAIAIAAAASVPASAATGPFPEYARCVKTEKVGKTYTGEYTERECETNASPAKTGKYERQEASSGTFEAAGKGATLITHSTKGVAESIVCKRTASRGELLASDVYATDRTTFEGCVGNGEKKTNLCGNVGGLEVIQAEPLFTSLVWLDKGGSEPGIFFEAEGEQVAKFKCGTEQVDLRGYLVGTVQNSKKGHTITFAVNSSRQQAHRSVWVFGSESRSLYLYTEPKAKERVESTLEAVEEQKETGVY